MTDTATLKDLLSRVEKATGPDSALECRIAIDLQGSPHPDGWLEVVNPMEPGTIALTPPPDVTSSVDAALAFMREMLKGTHLTVGLNTTLSTGWSHAFIPGPPIEAYAESLPLAIIAATLKALIAEKSDE